MDLEQMQRLLERQQSRIDIMNLMGRYQYYHTGGQMDKIGRELFAWWLPRRPVRVRPAWGVWPQKSLQFLTP